MITLTLTEAQVARICYAMSSEGAEATMRINAVRNNHSAWAAYVSHAELIHRASRDEALAIYRLASDAMAEARP